MTIAVIKRARGAVIKSGVNSAEVRRQAALSEAGATAAAISASTAAGAAQATLTALDGTVVTTLTSPTPANGSIEILLTDAGSQVWKVVSSAWVFQGWLNRAPGGQIRTSEATASATLANVKLVPFTIERNTVVNRVDITITTAATNATLFEIGLFSESYSKLASSGPREATPAGRRTIALPETTLTPGRYFFAITTNSATLAVAVNDYSGGYTATAAFPLPASAASPTLAAQAPSVTIKEKALPPVQNLFSLETGRNVRVYGVDETTRQPWGLNTTTFKMAVSVDSGATFTDKMSVPPGALTTGGGICDLIVHGSKLYVLTNALTLHMSSDLTATATWTDITCPLKSANAKGRPYGMAVLSGYLFIGEYTQSPNEVRTTGQTPGPDPTRGPRIFRYDITGGTWSISKEFLEARHIHSFYAEGSVALWVSLGDAGWGSEIGLYRLTPSGIGTGSGGTDSWLKWTTPASPRTDHYPVDFLIAGDANFNGEQWKSKFLLTSDRPGYHLLEAARLGTVAGSVNIGAQLFTRPGAPSGETVRSLVLDTDTKNAFYWTAETSEPGIYVSPPPYTQAVKLADYSDPNLFRAVYSGGYVMLFNSRFRVEKFVGQT